MVDSRNTFSVPLKCEPSDLTATARSWNEIYKGRSYQLLWKHITNHRMKNKGSELYESMCAIVQSSGMGKSRMTDELGKNHFLIPINLRNSTAGGYPPPDVEVRKYLTRQGVTKQNLESAKQARGRCFVFLYGLLKQTLLELQHVKQKGTTKQEMTEWFYNQMSPPEENEFRARFFQDVLRIAKQQGDAQAEKSIDSMLVDSTQDLVKFLRRADTRATQDEVEVVLAFDEAHVLCDTVNYDPTSGRQPWSMLIMLREVLQCLYTVPVWSLFISTMGKVSQFDPHHRIDPSMRIREKTYKTVPAFSTLTYDFFAPRIRRMRDGVLRHCEEWNNTGPPARKKAKGVLKGKCLMLENVTKTKFIVKFGRPLFYLMWHHGESAVQTDIIRFAMTKLICDYPTKFTTDWKSDVPLHVVFACLSQRLCIEFNTSRHNTDEETQITSHMRLCLKIGSDNKSIMSSSGSEPILAEAAATIMQLEVFKAAESLKRVISGFAINKGYRGELVALLAITRARDMAVKQKMKEIGLYSGPAGYIHMKVEESKPMFRAVTVMEFLSQLFSLDNLEKSDLCGLSRDFKYAYVYFNHFVKPFDRSTYTLRFLLQYMTRGAGALSSSNMPGIDALFSILFESEKGIILREDHMSIVLLQVENDPHIKRQSHEKWIMRRIENIARQILIDSGDPRPVIRIIFSLSSPAELWYSKSAITLENGESVIAHDFWCGGIGNFLLPKDNESKSTWEALVSATMKLKELFKEEDPGLEEFREEYESLCPGGSQSDSFWSWIQESNDDIEESDIEETSVGKKRKWKSRRN